MLLRRTGDRGFTLVELIIVIIIIGILAALAIPQFVTSARDAQEATLSGDMAVMRNAINLYYHQHTNIYPGAVEHTTGSGAPADAEASFIAQLSQYSDRTGKISATLDRANYPFGPYLMRGIPDNPLPASGAIGAEDEVNVVTDTTALSADGTPTKGWKFSNATGEFIANNATYQSW